MKTSLHSTALLWLALAAAGAGAQPCPTLTLGFGPAIDVTTYPDAPFRWRDIATNLYAQAYQDNYLYADAVATVTFSTCPHLAFAGHFSASNLKPNFAYQMKLEGKPTAIWGDDGDDVTNERLGYAGRWWRVQPDPGNANDADYEAHHNDPAYIYLGYLIFTFLISDSTGCAEVDFVLDSSYHVLWWEHQRPQGACDSPVQWHAVIGHASDPAYEMEVGPTEVGVYAEIERQCTGTTSLPLGDYDCRFLLTEESFHQSGPGDGGWVAALACDTLQFTLSDWTEAALPGPGSRCRISMRGPNPFHGRTSLELRLLAAADVRLTIHDLAGRLVRELVAGSLRAGQHPFQWDGRWHDGRRAAAGIYVYRLEAAGALHDSGKILLLK